MTLTHLIMLGLIDGAGSAGAPATSGFGFVVIADREDDEASVSVFGESDVVLDVFGDDE